jgi:hypothetical protein
VFRKSFCKSSFPHKFVNLSFIVTGIKNKLTDLCGNWLLFHEHFLWDKTPQPHLTDQSSPQYKPRLD